ncbi:MAG: NAD(P)H-dependent glycerol-3-phosphate dehydrogenase [Clostridia bacterium]|nr:NAD(P)H-dependent glycerol-3-phosphate dehydrogenase [Clostridia bacterium]
MTKNICIIGSGSWGVALGIHLSGLNNNVKIWSYSKEEADMINNQKRCKFLPNVIIPSSIICTTDFQEAIQGSSMILIVTPSKVVREILVKCKKYITNQSIIICSKGFEKNTLYTLNEVVEEELPNSKIGGLSGPSHAEEVSMAIPTALVIASKHEDVLEDVQKTFMNETLRIYKSYDIKGAELGGALKNIIALCSGIAKALELGDNTFAALLTRGLSEMAKLSIKMGGEPETIYGLTGLRRFNSNLFK